MGVAGLGLPPWGTSVPLLGCLGIIFRWHCLQFGSHQCQDSFGGHPGQGSLKDTCCNHLKHVLFQQNKGTPPFTRQCAGVFHVRIPVGPHALPLAPAWKPFPAGSAGGAGPSGLGLKNVWRLLPLTNQAIMLTPYQSTPWLINGGVWLWVKCGIYQTTFGGNTPPMNKLGLINGEST